MPICYFQMQEGILAEDCRERGYEWLFTLAMPSKWIMMKIKALAKTLHN